MTLRQLITRMMESGLPLDNPVTVRIVERDAENCVTRAKNVGNVTVNSWGHVYLEMSEIDNAPWDE